MKPYFFVFIVFFALTLACCGGKQPSETEKKPEAETDTTAAEGEAEKPEVVSAQQRIREWLGKDLTEQIATLGKNLGKEIGLKLAEDGEVLGAARELSKVVLEDKDIKKRLKKIEEKATAGLGNKLTLGWKALQAGGIDEYKKKVGADAKRVATDVLADHLKNKVLKDERMAALLKSFTEVFKVQGKVAAVGLQENVSPRVTNKILGIALRIAAAGDNAAMAEKVEAWIEGCADHTQEEVDKLFAKVATLEALKSAVSSLALEILKHERTANEFKQMVNRLLDDSSVTSSLVKVYEAAAFEKGDAKIRESMERTLALPTVDNELFATMERLAEAPGGTDMISRHALAISEDPGLATIVEDFVMSILEGCGDPTAS